MKKVKRLNINGHTAIFSESKDGGYVVEIPSLYGTFTQGETLKEAEAMAKDAIMGFQESASNSNPVVVPMVKGLLKREVLRGIIKQSGISLKEFMKA